jgi:23S rRNA pseudouridine1911/1915/1917 synthase
MSAFTHTITETLPAGGMRLDRYIAERLGLLSRSQIKARELKAAVNGKETKVSHIVKSGDALELSWKEAEPVNIIPENIPLDILFEDDREVVINKVQGMVVHPGAGNRRGTLANALYYRRLERVNGLGGSSPLEGFRPGIVHRLDKETSGVIIAAYDDTALAFLAAQFKSRKAKKTYIAIVKGIPPEQKGRIETFIARDLKDRKRFAVSTRGVSPRGKEAITLYRVIHTWQNHSLVLLRPRTGRTHQLRVHLRYLGHPVVGDPLYGFADTLFPAATLMLHARSLAIILPGEEKERIFTAPLPERFITMIEQLGIRNRMQ